MFLLHAKTVVKERVRGGVVQFSVVFGFGQQGVFPNLRSLPHTFSCFLNIFDIFS